MVQLATLVIFLVIASCLANNHKIIDSPFEADKSVWQSSGANYEGVKLSAATSRVVFDDMSMNWSPLPRAAYMGDQKSAVEFLDSPSATSDKIDETTEINGWTALHYAAQNGDITLTEALLTHEADPLVTSSDGGNLTAYDVAVLNGHPAVGLMLADNMLMRGIDDYNRELIAFAVAVGAYVDITNGPKGWTALLVACDRGDMSLARYLVEGGGANVNHLDGSGWNALMIAAYEGNIELAKLLMRHGANPLLRSFDGHTARSIAVMRGNKEMLDLVESAIDNHVGTLQRVMASGHARTRKVSKGVHVTVWPEEQRQQEQCNNGSGPIGKGKMIHEEHAGGVAVELNNEAPLVETTSMGQRMSDVWADFLGGTMELLSNWESLFCAAAASRGAGSLCDEHAHSILASTYSQMLTMALWCLLMLLQRRENGEADV